MSFFSRILAFFSQTGMKATKENGEPLTKEDIQSVESSFEFQSLLQTEQAAELKKLAAQMDTLTQKIEALENSANAAEATAAQALALATDATHLATAADTRATAVTKTVLKMQGAPMQMKGEDTPPVGTPDAANVTEAEQSYKRLFDMFRATVPVEDAHEKAVRMSGFNPDKNK